VGLQTIKKVGNYGTSTILKNFNIQNKCVKDFKCGGEMNSDKI